MKRRKRKRNPHQDTEKEAVDYVRGVVNRMAWIFSGRYPEPPDWEKPMIMDMMKLAMNGSDKALEWLKQRFPPSKLN